MAELVFFRRGEEVLRFAFDKARIVLGRGERCDVVVPDPEVSRQQVALTLSDGECRFDDLSGKGTEVGGKRHTQGTLADGADVALGQWRAVYRAVSQTDAETATVIGQRTEIGEGQPAKGATLPAQLRVTGNGQDQVHRLQAESFTVGKDAGNDLVLGHRFVSGRHLKVTRHDNVFHLVDQGSTNGTWLGPVRIFEAELPFFSTLRVGEAELTIEPHAGAKATTSYQGMIGNDPSVRQVAELIERVAPSTAAVAIFGESGTGKELVAQALHARSNRSNGPFVPVNCAAISKELIESELFGHEKGAFTGATNARKGAFEEADGGTIFLDEIGELPLELQAKLLRALESGEIKRVGASRPITVDTRIVAATNRDLLKSSRDGEFREDLYYRLCVIPLTLPPLRNRRGDVPPLAEHFVRIFSPKGQPVHLTPGAVARLEQHPWPGNIRELRNVVHRALLLRKGHAIDVGDLTFDEPDPDALGGVGGALEFVPGQSLTQALEKAERQIIESALKRFGNNRERVAKELGVARSTLFKRLKDWGLTNPQDVDA